MAPKDHPFMTCLVKVDTQNTFCHKWQKTVAGILEKFHGINNFRVNGDGLFEISGTIDPNVLLKKLARVGKRVELLWFQFGQCSSNLSMAAPDEWGNYNDGRYLHHTDNIAPPHEIMAQPLPHNYEPDYRPYYNNNHGCYRDHYYDHYCPYRDDNMSFCTIM